MERTLVYLFLSFYVSLAFGFKSWLGENEIDVYSRHVHSKSPASEIQGEVDILKLMNVSAKDPGVSIVSGPIAQYPAYKFRLPYENVPLANSSAVTSAMSSAAALDPKTKTGGGFTVVFLYRQQRFNLGTLISVNSPGRLTPWFQLASNSRTNMLTVKWRGGDTAERLRQIEWPLPPAGHHRKSPLAAWIWMSLSVDTNTETLRLDLDCLPSRFESLANNGGGNSAAAAAAATVASKQMPATQQQRRRSSLIGVPQDSLVYFRQEPGRKKKFLGSMQVAKILPYVTQDRLWNCVHISEKQAAQHRKPLV